MTKTVVSGQGSGVSKDSPISKIYLVRSTSGDYSDRTEETIRAYRSEAKCQEAVLGAGQYLREYFSRRALSGRQGKWKSPYAPSKEAPWLDTDCFLEVVDFDEEILK